MTENKRFKVVDLEEELYPMPIYYDKGKELGYNEVCVLLNTLYNENEQLKFILLDMLEISLQTKSVREVYCKGLLALFDKANSLNQAREMIKEHLK